MGSSPSLARTRLEWARSLLDSGRSADDPEVAAQLGQATAVASELGMATVARRARALATTG